MGISIVESRPTTHHINMATASATVLRARFFSTYSRKKLRSHWSMPLSLRSISKIFAAQTLDLALVERQFAVCNAGRQRTRRYISPQQFAQSLAQILDSNIASD